MLHTENSRGCAVDCPAGIASSEKLACHVCPLHWEEAQREREKLSFLAAIFWSKIFLRPLLLPEFTFPAYTFQEPELAGLINSYSRFNKQIWVRRSAQTEEWHASGKLAFFEHLQRHRDAEKEEAWAVLSVRKEYLGLKWGLRIFQSRGTVFFNLLYLALEIEARVPCMLDKYLPLSYNLDFYLLVTMMFKKN